MKVEDYLNTVTATALENIYENSGWDVLFVKMVYMIMM